MTPRFISTQNQVKMWTHPQLSNCISEIKTFLYLDSSKTKVMLLSSPHQLRNAGSLALFVDGVALELQSKCKNLGPKLWNPLPVDIRDDLSGRN